MLSCYQGDLEYRPKKKVGEDINVDEKGIPS